MCLLLITGCEDPTPKAGQITPPTPEARAETEAQVSKTKQIKSEETAKVKVAEKKEPEANESDYPYFHVYRDGENLVVEGVLKSNGQIDQITSELETNFPKLKVESGLRKDHRRHGVGWGNRVCDAVLFDYFTIVTDPDLEYKEGIITLRGTVKSDGEHRTVTERAIHAFSDVWTTDLVNEIKVSE